MIANNTDQSPSKSRVYSGSESLHVCKSRSEFRLESATVQRVMIRVKVKVTRSRLQGQGHKVKTKVEVEVKVGVRFCRLCSLSNSKSRSDPDTDSHPFLDPYPDRNARHSSIPKSLFLYSAPF